MRNSALLLSGALLAAAFSFGACNCDNNETAEDSGTPDTGGGVTDSGYDGAIIQTDGGPGSQCLPAGHPCTPSSGGVCCSGVCNADTGACAEAMFCKSPTEACTNDTECCTNNCVNGACSNIGCTGTNDPCTDNTQCCTGICSNGACQPLPGSTTTLPDGGTISNACSVTGEACSDGSECCSTNCQGGVCVRAYSCQANDDICYRNEDCCGNACSSTDGTTPGRCQQITGGGGGGCIQSGNPCDGPSNCCTRVCVNPGSGVTVCQQAGGCVMTGQFCTDDQSCCGGGTNPNGTVQCGSTDRCDNGQSCNPVGNGCGAAVLADGGSVNFSQNCCDGPPGSPNQPPYRGCKLDSSGIPRCFGGCTGPTGAECPPECPTGYTGIAPCCIAEGQQCQFKDQCCNGAPCVPGADGTLRCATAATCLGLGSACTPGADAGCCAGTECAQAEVGAVCRLPIPPTDGGTLPDGGAIDAGQPDAGLCKANGATCTVAGDCCSQICNAGTCEAPGQCQPQGAVCTSTADCCTGNSCQIPVGQTSGTCQPSSCQGAGQSCSPTNGCCTGLSCTNSTTGGTCDGTTACKCIVIIG